MGGPDRVGGQTLLGGPPLGGILLGGIQLFMRLNDPRKLLSDPRNVACPQLLRRKKTGYAKYAAGWLMSLYNYGALGRRGHGFQALQGTVGKLL